MAHEPPRENADKQRKTHSLHTIKIWLDSLTLEQAYIDYKKHIKVIAALGRQGIEVHAKPLTETEHHIS